MQNHALTVRELLRTHARCLGIKAKRFNCHMLLHQICALKNQRDRFFSSLWVLNRWLIPFGCKGGFLMQGVQRHHVLNGLFTPHSLTISSLMELCMHENMRQIVSVFSSLQKVSLMATKFFFFFQQKKLTTNSSNIRGAVKPKKRFFFT